MRNKIDLFSKKKNIFLSLTLIFALLTMIFLPIQITFAAPTSDVPVVVDGRTLSANMAGDTSAWIEIAQYNDYSLLVRKNFININSYGYGDHKRQYTTYGGSNVYGTSNVRDKINDWFNGVSMVENLPQDARLRSFTVQNTALEVVSSGQLVESMTDGFSIPTGVGASSGNDVAFALSFGEVANFCSIMHYLVKFEINPKAFQYIYSDPIAAKNFRKLTPISGLYYGMWTRSPGFKDVLQYPENAPESACMLYLSGSEITNALPSGTIGRISAVRLAPTSVYTDYNLVYPAVWVSSDVFETTPSSYRISYVLNGGVNAVGNPDSYAVSDLPLGVASPSRSGYEFLYWSASCANGTVVALSSSSVIPVGTKGDIVLSAVWSAIQYDITYVLSTGVNAPGNPVVYSVENAHLLSFADPELRGYTFLRWMVRCVNGTMFELSSAGVPVGTTGDLVVMAVWDPTPILYSISYVLDGGVGAAGNPVEYAVTSLFPVDIGNPSKVGFVFLGWVVVYSNGTVTSMVSSYGIPAGSACDVTLYAYWVPEVLSYNILYVLDGGVNAVGNPLVYGVAGLPVVVGSPVKAGFVFSYWVMSCADGSVVVLQDGVIPVGTTGDVVLSAVWSSVSVYSIVYVLGGGVNAVGNPSSYTVSDVFPIGIADPVLSGRVFLYWIAVYADGSLSVLPPTGIAAGTTGNLTLIAVWYP